MDLLKNLGEILSSTKKNISEKGKKASAAAKLRNIIMTEEKACERAYIALGKYYYHNLRDRNDLSAEPYCASLDTSKDKIDKAARKLEIYYKDEPEKNKELKEEISEILPEPEPSLKAYVYLRDDEEKDFIPEEGVLDESIVTNNKKDSEELDESHLSFE